MQICSINIKLHQSRPDRARTKQRRKKSPSEDEFIQSLSILKKNNARKVQKAMAQELYESMNLDFEDVWNEGTLQDAFVKVCVLSENADAPAKEEVWRPPGDVPLHLRSFDAEKILEESEKLQKYIDETNEKNEILMKKITDSRSKVQAVHNNVTQTLNRSPTTLQHLGKRLEQLEKCLKSLDEEFLITSE